MALMTSNLVDLIAKCLCLGRIHRYAHSSLRFLAKNSGFAAALGQKNTSRRVGDLPPAGWALDSIGRKLCLQGRPLAFDRLRGLA
jgi:hypothetical protein